MWRALRLAALFLVLGPTLAHAALAQVDTGTGTADGAGTTIDIALDVSGTNNAIYCAVVIDSGTSAPSASATWDTAGHNQAFSSIGSAANPGHAIQILRLSGADAGGEPGDGTGLTISITGLNAVVTDAAICVSYSGVDQTTPNDTIDFVEAGSGTSGSSLTITSPAGDWIASYIGLGSNFTGLAVAGGGQVIRASVQSAGPTQGLGYADDQDGADDTVDWTWTTDQRQTIASFNLNAAAAGGSTACRNLLLLGVGGGCS